VWGRDKRVVNILHITLVSERSDASTHLALNRERWCINTPEGIVIKTTIEAIPQMLLLFKKYNEKYHGKLKVRNSFK
jgi:hypothetical protein